MEEKDNKIEQFISDRHHILALKNDVEEALEGKDSEINDLKRQVEQVSFNFCIFFSLWKHSFQICKIKKIFLFPFYSDLTHSSINFMFFYLACSWMLSANFVSHS